MTGEKKGYTLVICEKPDAARKVADALSGGKAAATAVDGVSVFEFEGSGESYVVCAAQGHVFSLSDPMAERQVYPVFDAEWYDRGLVERGAAVASRRISTIRKLSAGAAQFVNACDYDVEGETIGFNILRYACGGKEESAKRAVFSALTRDELTEAFRAARAQGGMRLAAAGRARHLVDFVWGVNASRALSQASVMLGKRYRTISVGRVQGPALGFVVERERRIRAHVPRPFWTVKGTFARGKERLVAAYSRDRLLKKSEAEEVERDCLGKEGTVAGATRRSFGVPPPAAFNIGDLQKEAYRLFGYSPSRTLQAAERLYLDALISYPRTGSQRLPPSIGYERIIRGLAASRRYPRASDLLGGAVRPVQGGKDDPAHPAIHPTGETPRKALGTQEGRVYDLVVRRFLSAFAPEARKEGSSAEILVGAHSFTVEGTRTLTAGWLEYYSPYGRTADTPLPSVREGERLQVRGVEISEKFEPKPRRYTQSGLLEKMESERIGTKATRADTVATLVDRGYVRGESLTATDLGFAVIETMSRYAPSMVTTELTRSVEERLDAIEAGADDGKELVREAVRLISSQLVALRRNEETVGRAIESAAARTASGGGLGACPLCGNGVLRVVRSRKSGKRFVGCSNYGSGCRASAPLPQRGRLKPAAKPCNRCSWPVVYVIAGRSHWSLCVNPDCPSKGRKT